ncbi:hypothetical protein Hanom_Chr17g01546681 [Helianthus anomalus]
METQYDDVLRRFPTVLRLLASSRVSANGFSSDLVASVDLDPVSLGLSSITVASSCCCECGFCSSLQTLGKFLMLDFWYLSLSLRIKLYHNY